jgi:hypothetical protein
MSAPSPPARWARRLASKLDQIEGERNGSPSSLPTEGCNAVGVKDDGLAIDDAGLRSQVSQSFGDQREAARKVIAQTAKKPHLRPFLRAMTRKSSCLIW